MGQPTVSSVTWRNRIKHISQGFYETAGQQIRLATKAKAALALNHGKKSKWRFTLPGNICWGFAPFLSSFPAYGMAVKRIQKPYLERNVQHMQRQVQHMERVEQSLDRINKLLEKKD